MVRRYCPKSKTLNSISLIKSDMEKEGVNKDSFESKILIYPPLTDPLTHSLRFLISKSNFLSQLSKDHQ